MAGGEGGPAGTRRRLSGVPMAVGRGLVTSSHGCPWLGARAARRGLVAGSRLLLTPAGRQEAVAVLPLFLPSARFCIFTLNRLLCGLTEFGF